MQEQRLTFRLKSHWDALRKDQPFPTINQFNPQAVDDLWPFCFKVKITNSRPAQFTYEYMGEELAKLYGHDMTGMTVNRRVAHFPGSVLHERLENVLTTKNAMQDQGHLINYDSKLIRYRACLLPFGKEGELTHIICALSCRQFDG